MITFKQFLIGVLVLLIGINLASSMLSDSDESVVITNDAPEVAPKAPPVDWEREIFVEKEAAEERIDTLEEMRRNRDEIERTAKVMPLFRQRVLDSREGQWTSLLKKHGVEFNRMRKEVDASSELEIDCTICEGDTYMDFCIFCRDDSNGKCSGCKDGMDAFSDGLCPVCQGSEKCFMCAGTKLMMCPFCEDGVIEKSHADAPLKPMMR